MNILFLDQFSTIGGGQRGLLDLLPMTLARGWDSCVGLPADGPYARKIRGAGVECEIVPCPPYAPGRKQGGDILRFGRSLPKMARRIGEIVQQRRIEVIYVNGPRLLPAAALVARARAISLMFHVHHKITHPLAARVAGISLKYARAAMVSCCRFSELPLAPYLPVDRRRVIYNGVPEPEWKRRPRDPSQPWNIGVIGRVEPGNGQLQFVTAARILASETGDCHFIVAGAPLSSGDDYFDKVKAASQGLPIEFLGWQDDIGKVFSRLDLLVVPSCDTDSTPRVILEAFAGGLPVLAFPSGGIPEIVEDGRTGFFASGQSAAALAARIRSVIGMGIKPLRQVTESALAEWREKYSLEQFQKAVGDIILQVWLRTSAKNKKAANIAITPQARKTGE